MAKPSVKDEFDVYRNNRFWMICDRRLDPYELRVVLYLYLRVNESRGGVAWPSFNTMEADIGIGKTKLQKAIDKLESLGIVIRISGNAKKSNQYRIDLAAWEKGARACGMPPNDTGYAAARHRGMSPDAIGYAAGRHGGMPSHGTEQEVVEQEEKNNLHVCEQAPSAAEPPAGQQPRTQEGVCFSPVQQPSSEWDEWARSTGTKLRQKKADEFMGWAESHYARVAGCAIPAGCREEILAGVGRIGAESARLVIHEMARLQAGYDGKAIYPETFRQLCRSKMVSGRDFTKLEPPEASYASEVDHAVSREITEFADTVADALEGRASSRHNGKVDAMDVVLKMYEFVGFMEGQRIIVDELDVPPDAAAGICMAAIRMARCTATNKDEFDKMFTGPISANMVREMTDEQTATLVAAACSTGPVPPILVAAERGADSLMSQLCGDRYSAPALPMTQTTAMLGHGTESVNFHTTAAEVIAA